MRTFFSTIHIKNAVLLRDDAREIEATYRGEETSTIPAHAKRKHLAYVANSLLSSVAFLETLAKEFVVDLSEDTDEEIEGKMHYPDIDPDKRKAIVTAADLETRFECASPPVKFNVLLDVMGLPEFDREDDPLEPARLLILKDINT